MTQIIKSFDNYGNAEAAVRELRNNNFSDVTVTSHDSAGVALNGNGARVRPAEARVTVQAPFGTAAKAVAILDAHGANSPQVAVAASGPPHTHGGCACTVSSLLGIAELTTPGPVFSSFPLLIENPTPLSSMFGLPVLMHEHHS